MPASLSRSLASLLPSAIKQASPMIAAKLSLGTKDERATVARSDKRTADKAGRRADRT
jgi:hypothetical protein